MEYKKDAKNDSVVNKNEKRVEEKSRFNWDTFDLDKFFNDIERVGEIMKKKKRNEDDE